MKSQTHHIELKLNQIWTNPVCKIESWQNSTIGGWGECPYREINSFRSCLWNPCMHCLYYIYIYIVRTISKHHAELFFFFSFGSARRYCMGERKLLLLYIYIYGGNEPESSCWTFFFLSFIGRRYTAWANEKVTCATAGQRAAPWNNRPMSTLRNSQTHQVELDLNQISINHLCKIGSWQTTTTNLLYR